MLRLGNGAQPLSKPDGVRWGLRVDVVVEEGEEVPASLDLRPQEVGPFVEHAIRIAPRVPARAAMEPDVDRVAGDGTCSRIRRTAGHVVQAEPDPSPAKHRQDLVGHAELVPELDDVRERTDARPVVPGRVRGQGFDEGGEPLNVGHPPRWQLIQDGPEPRAEMLCVLEQPIHRLGGVLQLLHVRQVAAGLDGKQETRRNPAGPVRERLRRGQPIERTVHLDAVEHLRVRLEPEASRHVRVVEPRSPVRVVPTRAAYSDASPHVAIAREARATVSGRAGSRRDRHHQGRDT